MIVRVYIHPKVEKKLAHMKKQVKAPFIAAQRAKKIIQDIIEKSRFIGPGQCRPKKDARLNKLYKFNLGNGYRLACIREKSSIFVLFVGSHDSCDAWLNRYTNKNFRQWEASMNYYTTKQYNLKPCIHHTSPNHSDEEKDGHFVISEISQKILRNIFRGLAGN